MKFFVFPTDPEHRKRWTVAVGDLESELHERKSNLRLIQGSDAKTRFLYWATYLCCFHGTSQVYRAIHYSGLLTSQQFRQFVPGKKEMSFNW